jgi:hypothetical protein
VQNYYGLESRESANLEITDTYKKNELTTAFKLGN